MLTAGLNICLTVRVTLNAAYVTLSDVTLNAAYVTLSDVTVSVLSMGHSLDDVTSLLHTWLSL